VFIGTRQRGKLASYRIWRFDVQIVDTLNRAQPIAPTTIFPLSDEINRTVLMSTFILALHHSDSERELYLMGTDAGFWHVF
jgi:hypothetical protein